MPRAFAITAPTNSINLNDQGRGEVAFTVSNTSGGRLRGRAVVKALGSTQSDWLSVADESERDFDSQTVHQFTVEVAVPQGAPDGTYSFRLDVVSVEDPDDVFDEGPVIAFEVHKREEPASKPFPWWIVAAAAGFVVVVSIAIWIMVGLKPKPIPETASPPVITSPEPKSIYTIRASVSAGGGGTIEPSGRVELDKGGDKTFIIKPGEGYHTKDVIVDGKSEGAVTSYTFDNVTSDRKIEASFEISTYTIEVSLSAGRTDEKPDLIFMCVDDVDDAVGKDQFRYIYGSGLNADGSVGKWNSVVSKEIRDFESGGITNDGGGAAIGYINDNDKPDLVLMGINKSHPDYSFWYTVGFDIDPKKTTRWSEVIKVYGVGWLHDGGGAAIGYINDNWRPDLILMAVNAPDEDPNDPNTPSNSFRYTIGFDLDEKGVAKGGWRSSEVPGVGWAQQGGGAALAYLDDNEKPELILMGVNDVPERWKGNESGKNDFRYRICWNLGVDGQTTSPHPDCPIPPTLVSPTTDGGGADIAYIDKDALPDIIFMAIDDLPENNNFSYTIGWGLNEEGKVKGWRDIESTPAPGWSQAGGGVAVVRPLTKLRLVSPELGGNGKINFAKGSDVTFELKVTTPQNLDNRRGIIYRWWIYDMKRRKTTPSDVLFRGNLIKLKKGFDSLDPGEYEVYFQAIDHFASIPLKVAVTVKD